LNRWWLLTIILGLLLISACARTENEVSLGQEFTLAPGQSATVKNENLSIKFLSVTTDSRCPQGVTCVWAGEARCEVEITHSGTAFPLTLTQSGLSGPARADFQSYEITFNLLPYPQAGQETKSEDYRLQLTISRKPA